MYEEEFFELVLGLILTEDFNVPETLKRLRQTSKLSQEQMAHKIGIKVEDFAEWESGYVVPTVDDFIGIFRSIYDSEKVFGTSDTLVKRYRPFPYMIHISSSYREILDRGYYAEYLDEMKYSRDESKGTDLYGELTSDQQLAAVLSKEIWARNIPARNMIIAGIEDYIGGCTLYLHQGVIDAVNQLFPNTIDATWFKPASPDGNVLSSTNSDLAKYCADNDFDFELCEYKGIRVVSLPYVDHINASFLIAEVPHLFSEQIARDFVEFLKNGYLD